MFDVMYRLMMSKSCTFIPQHTPPYSTHRWTFPPSTTIGVILGRIPFAYRQLTRSKCHRPMSGSSKGVFNLNQLSTRNPGSNQRVVGVQLLITQLFAVLD